MGFPPPLVVSSLSPRSRSPLHLATALLVLAATACGSFAVRDVADAASSMACEVTAYYSPLPGQKRYSYNAKTRRYRTFKQELALQGNGTNGASGKPVFAGMIAAPKRYAFGTKIEIPGFGVGEVQDRGGAIKGNRVDLYFGKGYNALVRAERWGRRKTTCTVL